MADETLDLKVHHQTHIQHPDQATHKHLIDSFLEHVPMLGRHTRTVDLLDDEHSMHIEREIKQHLTAMAAKWGGSKEREIMLVNMRTAGTGYALFGVDNMIGMGFGSLGERFDVMMDPENDNESEDENHYKNVLLQHVLFLDLAAMISHLRRWHHHTLLQDALILFGQEFQDRALPLRQHDSHKLHLFVQEPDLAKLDIKILEDFGITALKHGVEQHVNEHSFVYSPFAPLPENIQTANATAIITHYLNPRKIDATPRELKDFIEGNYQRCPFLDIDRKRSDPIATAHMEQSLWVRTNLLQS